MNKLVQYLNLTGLLALSAVCLVQSKTNGDLDRAIVAAREKDASQSRLIATQEATIKDSEAESADRGTRLAMAEDQLKKVQNLLTSVRTENQRLSSRNQKLNELTSKFVEGISARDKIVEAQSVALNKQHDVISRVEAERDQAIKSFNDLATKYDALSRKQ